MAMNWIKALATLAIAFSGFAGAQNLIPNPGLEDGADKPTGWNFRENGAAGAEAHGGKRAATLKSKPGEKWNVVNSPSFALKGATLYTLTFWAKVDGGGNFQGGLRELDAAGKTLTYTWQKTRQNVGWVEYAAVVKTRPGAVKGEFYAQAMEDFSGQAWIDDLSLVEGGDPDAAKKRAASRRSATNLLEDPGFESGGKGWSLPAEGRISATGGNTGAACVIIDNPDRKKKSPIAAFSFPDIPANRVYTFSARVKSMGVGEEGPKLKIEFYNAKGENTGGVYSLPLIAAGVWNQVSVKLRAGRDTERATLLLRQFGNGEAAFDDLDFRFTDPVPFDMEVSPRVAYIGGELKPEVKVFLNSDDLASMAGFQAKLSVVDAVSGTVLIAPLLQKADKAALSFSLALPASKPRQFNVEASLLDPSGKVRFATNDLAIVVERPSLVRSGCYVVDGKPFFPIGAYHVKHESEYPLLLSGGFNAVQGSGTHDLGVLKKHLDECAASGLRYCLPLYGGMKVRGNFSNTRAKLKAFAEHPALLGFWSMDEPDVWGVGPDELVELRAIIGAGTRVHPASSVIFPPSAHFMGQQESMDVIYVDPYPKKKNPEPITAVRTWIDGAKRAQKPIVCVVQAFEMLPAWPKPSAAELENYIYQSLVHGAIGIFYYSMNDPSWNLAQSDLWEKTLQMNREMKALAPVLLSEAMRRETWNVKSNPAVDAVAAVVNGETWVLAVNVSDKEADLSVALPAGAKGAVSAVFGRGKPVLKDGKIVDSIEALGSRVYVVK